MENVPKKEPSSTMIYVSNLPFTTEDANLRELFKDFEVKTAYVAKRRNGRSKGFGFVNLAKEGDQQKALAAVDGKEVDGRKITAKIAFNDDRRNELGELKEQFKQQLPTKTEGPPSETVVYVSNLPWSFKDEDLKKLFSDLGVKNANVAVRKNGRSKGFGFVEFNTKEDQAKALQKDQTKIEDRTITVKASVNYRGAGNQNPTTQGAGQQRRRPTRSQGGNNRRGNNNNNNNNRGGNQGGNRRGNNNNNNNRGGNQGGNNNRQQQPRVATENSLYVSNLPWDLDNNDLKQIFSEFNVKNAHVATRFNGRSKGFGFVEFNNEKDQKAAQEALDQSEVNNRTITVKIATGKSQSTGNRGGNRGGNRNNNNNNNRGGNRSNNQGGNRTRRTSNTNEKREPSATMVYVSNLPFTVDDKALTQVFTGYKVTNAYVAKRRNGRSKGFGFVDFASSEDQQKALKLNGQEVEGRPLTIQIANKVDAKENQTQNK